ncbi:MAG: hypothetical protein EB003_13830, partial [Flavobacteriia bacterium]|nr:hypothetical protein [Flavobacteriia bacterium]
EKEHSDENDLISWHYSHSQGRVVKGINLLSALAVYDEASIPVAFELITKPVVMCDLATKKEVRKAEKTKNEMMREMLEVCLKNIKFKYILADIWFNSNENLKKIHSIKKLFIIACKSNRKIALSAEDRKNGIWTKVSEIKLESEEVKVVYFEGLDFPLSLTKKVFKNKDDSTGTLYLISNEIGSTGTHLYNVYKKRWKVEEYHKSLKSNVSFRKSPARKVKTQSKKVNKSWLNDHVNDPYVKLAKKDGYRARAAYKLKEIDEQLGLIKPGHLVVDLGSTPGAWSQYVRRRLSPDGAAVGALNGTIIAVDILPMEPVEGVLFINGDFREPSVLAQLETVLQGRMADVVVSDMAPNLSGIE